MPTKIRGKKDAKQSVKDPVCGEMVETKTSVSETEEGQDYFFCSEDCRQKFLANPAEYTET